MILITGGAGYLGSHLNKALHRAGYSTLIVDDFSHGNRDMVKWGKLIEGDLCNKDFAFQVFKENPIKTVIHLANHISVAESMVRPAKYYRNNLFSAINILDAMRENNIKNILFSSSCAMYGNINEVPIPEHYTPKPVSPYGHTNFMTETIIKDYARAYQLRYMIMRFFNSGGADPELELGESHKPETHIIPILFDVVTGVRPYFEIFGADHPTPDGTCIRDYLHISDLAEGFVKALEYMNDKERSNEFNFGSGVGTSIREIVKMVEKVTGKTVAVKELPARDGDAVIMVGSSAKTKHVLGWQPKYSDLETIVTTSWQWYNRMRKD